MSSFNRRIYVSLFLNKRMSGSLAQLVEQLTFNQLVDGSNPS